MNRIIKQQKLMNTYKTCKESEIPFINYGKHINPRKHPDRSKLQLNEKGFFTLGKTFLDHIKFLFD